MAPGAVATTTSMSSRRRSVTLIAFDILLDRSGVEPDGAGMPSWSDFAAAAPELAVTVRNRFDAHPFTLLATLRADGSPRISGIEVDFLDDGELRAGSMPRSGKSNDLDRDGRFCLHNVPAPRDTWTGDAKLSGIAHPTTGPQPDARYYRLALNEVATVTVCEGQLHLALWTPEHGVRRWAR